MAKKAKKRKKVHQPIQTNPKRYIMDKARSLPITKCLIENNWKESSLVNIIVERRMPSGNLIIGIYLVDLLCLGLKTTGYFFNKSDFEWTDIKKGAEGMERMIECRYALVHKIIYGAIDFAAEAGFYPHKDFSFTKYFLEPEEEIDSDDVVEFGKDGIHHFFNTIGDNIPQILGTLRKNLGEGNFYLTLSNKDDEIIFDNTEETLQGQDFDDGDNFSDIVDENAEYSLEELLRIDAENIGFLLKGYVNDEILEDEMLDSIEPFEDLLPGLKIITDPILDSEGIEFLNEALLEDHDAFKNVDEETAARVDNMTANDSYVAELYIKITYLYNRYSSDDKKTSEILENAALRFPSKVIIPLYWALKCIENEEGAKAIATMRNKWRWEDHLIGRQDVNIEEIILFNVLRIAFLRQNGCAKETTSIYIDVCQNFGTYEAFNSLRFYVYEMLFAKRLERIEGTYHKNASKTNEDVLKLIYETLPAAALGLDSLLKDV